MENNFERHSDLPRRTASTGRRHSSTREMILRMVEAQAEAMPTSVFVQATGLHENTVRGHLEHLLTDRFVVREVAPAIGRGRPAWLWRARTDDVAAPYAALATALAEILAATSADPVADAREAGRNWGRQLAQSEPAASDSASDSDSDASRDVVVEVMGKAGFAPHDTGDDVILRRCPLIDAAAKHPSIVCSVHLGMVDGVLEASGGSGDAKLEPFTAPGECTLHLRIAS